MITSSSVPLSILSPSPLHLALVRVAAPVTKSRLAVGGLAEEHLGRLSINTVVGWGFAMRTAARVSNADKSTVTVSRGVAQLY